MEQVHSGASPTASAPTGILFVGREMPVVSRPPACLEGRSHPLEQGLTHTHTAALIMLRTKDIERRKQTKEKQF